MNEWYNRERDAERITDTKPLCGSLPTPSRDLGDFLDVANYLSDRKLDYSLTIANGWYPSREAGDDYLRVVMPATSRDQHNKFWQARAVLSGVKPKYQSPHHVRRGDAIILVWPYRYRDWGLSGCVVTEGPMDALAAASVGYLGAAMMGLMPNEEAIENLRRWVRHPLIVVPDSDQHGGAFVKTVWSRFPGAYLANPYPDKDLAEMPEIKRRHFLQAVVQDRG